MSKKSKSVKKWIKELKPIIKQGNLSSFILACLLVLAFLRLMINGVTLISQSSKLDPIGYGTLVYFGMAFGIVAGVIPVWYFRNIIPWGILGTTMVLLILNFLFQPDYWPWVLAIAPLCICAISDILAKWSNQARGLA